MKLARNILIIFSYIMFTVLIIVGPDFHKYKLYVLLLQVLFFCTGPLLLIFIDRKRKRSKDKINSKSE
jgi:amino acid transporter